MGAAGGFLAALVGELLLAFLFPVPPKAPVDVVFVLDVTSSMEREIRGVQQGIGDFASQIQSRNLDVQMALVAFRDRFYGEEPQVLSFAGRPFTSNSASFSREVDALHASGGGDPPESVLDALNLAARLPFRPNAVRVLILITDAAPKVPDKEMQSNEEVVRALRDNKIQQLHLVTPPQLLIAFETIRGAAPGEVFSLREALEGKQNFDRLLGVLGHQVATATLKSFQSDVKFSRESAGQLIAAVALWTGLLAAGIAVALILAQSRYVRSERRPLWPSVAGGGGGFIAGVVAGGVGQLLFTGLGGISFPDHIARSLAWSALGAVLAFGMSFFVPNLKATRALAGGAIGGLAAAIGFLAVSGALADWLGRMMGAAVLGFFIGIMIALVEAIFREAWLEIRYGPREIRIVSLGGEPISLGSNQKACTVYAANAPAIAYRYWLKDNAIFCEDVVVQRTVNVFPGDSKHVGNLVATVCAAGKSGASVSPALAQKKVNGHFSLRLSDGRSIELSSGAKLTGSELRGLRSVPPGGPVATITSHPTEPSIRGLQNLSQQSWTAHLANGDKVEVKPGKNVRLVAGTRVNFGSIEGTIEC
jgi:Ca-activated chloride channel family protein